MKRYAAIDVDGSGSIEIAELRKALKRFDMKLTDEQLDKIMLLLDKDGNKEISYSELSAAFVRAGEQEEPPGSYEDAMAKAIVQRSSEARHRSLNDSQEIAAQQTEEERTAKRREAEQASVIEVMLNAVKGKRTLFGQKLENPKALFEAMDKDGSSSISVEEFRQAISRLGLGLSEQQTAAVVSTIDADGNGEIVYEEFVERLWRHVERRQAEKDAVKNPELSALQEQERHRKEAERAEEELRAAPTEDQAKSRAQALVENRMEVLRNAVVYGSTQTKGKGKQKARKLYGVDVTSVATLFCLIDKDGSGSIDTSELRQALTRMSLEVSDEQLELIVADIDKDGNLELSYEELCEAIGVTEDEQVYQAAKAEAAKRRENEQRKDQHKAKLLSKAEAGAHARERAEKRTQAARENVMRVLRLATMPIPPSTLRPRGGHRTLYGKKLVDQMSVFNAIDRDGSGEITIEELMDALKRLGADVAEDQLREMVAAFDDDGNGLLNYHEFFLAAEAERVSVAARAKAHASRFNRDAKTRPTRAGGAASVAGATRRRRAGGGWHVSSKPTIWSKMLSAHPAKIGRSVKSSQNQAGLGAVGTMVSGNTAAPYWSLAAAAYVSPDYDPTPPRSGFGISEGDPVMCWPPIKRGTSSRMSTSPTYGQVQSWSMDVPLGRSPKVEVRILDPNIKSPDGAPVIRTCSAGSTVRRRRRVHALHLGVTASHPRKKKNSSGIRKKHPSSRSMSLASAAALRSSTASKTKELKTVKVKTSTGLLLEDIKVSSKDTVGELKRQCEERQKLEVGSMEAQRLLFAGKAMGDTRTLGEFGVYDGALLVAHKPNTWSTHLEGYKYTTLQYWDKSTVPAGRRVRTTKPSLDDANDSASPIDFTASEEHAADKEPEVDKLAVAAAEAHKKSLARMLQRKVHAELSNRHISARAAFSAFVSCEQEGVKLATVDDLRRGFEELGVRMPIGANGKRPRLANVINDVLSGMSEVAGGRDSGGDETGGNGTGLSGRVRKVGKLLAVDETTFQLWIAPEPSEVATIYTEKILAAFPVDQDGTADGRPGMGPPVSKAVERAQRTVDVLETQLEEMQRRISNAEEEHKRTLEAEARADARRAVELQRMELEYESSQNVLAGRKEELAEAIANRKAAVQARKDAEAAQHKGATRGDTVLCCVAVRLFTVLSST